MKETVQVPQEFFRKELKEYKSWRLAFLREVIQNSYDACASEIHINMTNNESITVIDNGIGMDLDTLRNKFFCLGGSLKDANSIGGFGKAKTLICFGQKSYKILTREHEVNGEGGEFEITPLPSTLYFDGTLFKIELNPSNIYNESELFYDSLLTIVEYSTFSKPFKIIWNGKEVQKQKRRKLRFTIDGEHCRVNFDISNRDYCYVACNGLFMHSHHIYNSNPKKHLLVEVNIHDGLESLCSNRDTLQGVAEREVRKILNEVLDTLGQIQKQNAVAMIINTSYTQNEREESYRRSSSSGSTSYNHTPTIRDGGGVNPEHLKTFSKLEKLISGDLKRGDESFCAALYPRNFHIQAVEEMRRKCFSYLRTQKGPKWSYNWVKLVNAVLGVASKLDNFRGYIRSDYEFGFIFNPDLDAALTGGNLFLLNPSTLPPRANLDDLLDLAIHEVVHTVIPNHCDDFCTYEMQLRRACRKELKNLKTICH